MIVVDGLRKSIRNGARMVDILKGLDFTIPSGQFAAIMGSSKTPGQASVSSTCDSRASRCKAWAMRRSSTAAPRCSCSS